MAAADLSKKGKQAIASLSSPFSEEDEESETDGSDEDYVEDGEEESSSEDGSRSTSDDDDDDALKRKSNDEDDDDDALKRKSNDEELCDKVMDHLRERRNLSTLKLHECKSYLRKHELRLSGTKATCIERILVHWRIKDGNSEKLYPRKSFVINCAGDICRGDVILFKQRFFNRFDKVKWGGNVIRKRIIAGRVLKESYDEAKQQHTFTVEILWSKGFNALPPLFVLLVKGRKLYSLKPFRQRWKNEVERSKVLDEKHKRGAVARSRWKNEVERSMVLDEKHKRGAAARRRWRNEVEGSKVLDEKHKRGAAARHRWRNKVERSKVLDEKNKKGAAARRRWRNKVERSNVLDEKHKRGAAARRRWRNEVEKSKVLDEKHKRGAAARHVRAIAKAKSANRGSKNHLDTSTAREPPRKRRKRDPETSIKKKPNSITCSKAPLSNGCTEWKRVPDIKPPEPSMNSPRHTSYHGHGIDTYPTFHQRILPYDPYNQRELDLRSPNMLHLPLYNPGFSSAEFYMRHPYVNPPPQFYPRSSGHMLRRAHLNHGGRYDPYYNQRELDLRSRNMLHLPLYNPGFSSTEFYMRRHPCVNPPPQFYPRSSSHMLRRAHFNHGDSYDPNYNQRELDLRSRNMLHLPLYNPGFSSAEFYMRHHYVNAPPQFYRWSFGHMLRRAHFNHSGPEGPSGEQFYRWWA